MIMNFSKKRKGEILTDKFLLKIGGVLLFTVVIVLIVADYRIYQKRQGLIKQIEEYNKQINEIKQKNANLKEQITQSNNDDYIEKVAREELNLQKPGESVVSFIMPEKKIENQEQKLSNTWFGWLSQSWSWIKSRF
jgi:cell division protein DivIC